MTLFADGLIVERELLTMHWGPPARAIVFAMPLTLVILALIAAGLFGELSWAEAFLLAAVLTPTDPVVTSAVVTAQRVPSRVRHTLNLESGLNDGLALPFVLFFLVLATPGGDAGTRGGRAGRRGGRSARCWGWCSGSSAGACTGPRRPAGSRRATRGSSPSASGIAAYGLAEVTFGNGLIAAFVAGIALGRDRARDPRPLPRLRRERQHDLPGDDLLRLRGADRRHRVRRLGSGAGRVHPAGAAGRAPGGAADLARGHRLQATRARVHGVVRPEGGRLDAVRADRARVRGRPTTR